MLKERRKGSKHMWCGPFALSIILDTPYEKAYRKLLRLYNKNITFRPFKKKYIKGVSSSILRDAIQTKHRSFKWVEPDKSLTLHGLKDYLRHGSLYVVNTTTHYLLVDTSTWMIADNQLNDWKPIEYGHYKLARITKYGFVKRVT